MKKKGFELSINFLVTLIITIVVFVLAISFAYNFFSKSSVLTASIDQQTTAALRSMIMDQGMKVAVYPTQIEYKGKQEVMGIGILNILGAQTDFIITVQCKTCIGTGCSCSSMKAVYNNKLTIPNNKDDVAVLVIKSNGANPGTYIFDVTVTYPGSSDPYGGLQKVYVKI